MQISRAAARRFLVRSFALDGFQSLPDVATAVDRLQFVQEDSINVCGRIHDLILWARVRDYTNADLHRALYESPRQAFEYYFPTFPFCRSTIILTSRGRCGHDATRRDGGMG